MTDFTFEPATREQAKARIALAGPSGSGKTMTALYIASALGDKIAVIDTERGSASKYAPPPSRMASPGKGEFLFQRLDMHRYDPRDLAKALAAAAGHGFDVVIVDSLSKFWSGAGGMLEQVDNAGKRAFGGNSFAGWKEARPMESAMIEALLGFPGHVIVTMRTKTAFEITEDDRGRKVPQKIGLKPEQREGIEYEFDIVLDMDLQNAATVSKSRCPALTGRVIQRPDASLGEEILAWVSDGKAAMSATDYRDALCQPGISADTVRVLGNEIKGRGLSGASVIDDEGSTVTLLELAHRKYTEVARTERNGNGHQAPPEPPAAEKPPAQQARPARNGRPKQAAREEPAAGAVVTDREWMTDFIRRATSITLASEELGLRSEIAGQQKAGKCTDEDAAGMNQILDERAQQLLAEAQYENGMAADTEQGQLV
jgi:hypothetical protein